MQPDLRALTLTPEWAWAVCYLDKRVENRTWRPPAFMVGQRFAIHAGMRKPDWYAVERMAPRAGWAPGGWSFSRDGACIVMPAYGNLSSGAIVATAVLAGAREVAEFDCKGWEVGPWCLDLADVRVLPRPVPCKGALGFWRVPEGIVGEVLRG